MLVDLFKYESSVSPSLPLQPEVGLGLPKSCSPEPYVFKASTSPSNHLSLGLPHTRFQSVLAYSFNFIPNICAVDLSLNRLIRMLICRSVLMEENAFDVFHPFSFLFFFFSWGKISIPFSKKQNVMVFPFPFPISMPLSNLWFIRLQG